MRNKCFYEKVSEISVWRRFREAACILCVGSGSLNERVYRAFYDATIFHLNYENFDDKYFRDTLKRISDIVHSGMPKLSLPSGVCVDVKRLNLHWKKAKYVAESILDLYEYLTKIQIKQHEIY